MPSTTTSCGRSTRLKRWPGSPSAFGIGRGASVVDLAAGTGRLSGRFLQLGVDVIAVEPAANMRAVLEERFPAVRAIVATAESMPFDDGAVDAGRGGQRVPSLRPRRGDGGDPSGPRPGGGLAVRWAWPNEEYVKPKNRT